MIELPKNYRMNVLILKMITLNSSYGLSKIALSKYQTIANVVLHVSMYGRVNMLHTLYSSRTYVDNIHTAGS